MNKTVDSVLAEVGKKLGINLIGSLSTVETGDGYFVAKPIMVAAGKWNLVLWETVPKEFSKTFTGEYQYDNLRVKFLGDRLVKVYLVGNIRRFLKI